MSESCPEVVLVTEMEIELALQQLQDCGITPCEFKVLILPDESDVLLSYRRAGLTTPDEVNERYRAASMTGHIVAMSPAAFSYHEWDQEVRLPRIGDRVVYARYAGINIKGPRFKNERGHEDRREYRLLNDKDIAAIS